MRPIPKHSRLLLPMLAAMLCCACQRTSSATPAGEPPFPYQEAGIAELQARITAGELDSVTLTDAYLRRIALLDRAGPALRSVIEINPAARREAAQRDAERRAGRIRGPLHGMPILLKDNIGATPMHNTAGSLALKTFRPRRDAFLVQRLREAGAVILGKTNLSEWANFRSTGSTSGWSALGGQTRNPYALDRNPCGSSSGSAVAVAANLAVAAIGTETDGSIVCPAAVTGIVGLKPTVGLVSRDGIIPISFSQDTAGPMARSVADAALLLAAMAGRDESDPATATMPGRAVYDYGARLRPDALHGARIGVLRNALAERAEIKPLLDQAVAAMRAAGATVIDTALPSEDGWEKDEQTVLLYEFKNGLNRYFQQWRTPVASLGALIAFNDAHASQELHLFGQELLLQAEQAGSLNDPIYIAARGNARRLAGAEGIDATLRADQLDALIAPTTGAAWRTTPGKGDDYPGGSYGAAAVAGYPSLSVPMGHANGLPLGLLFMGPAWSEPRLLELGHAYEQLTRARRPPAFAPTP
ncbi:MAG: amidase [Stenotrophomonas nitritireducens]|uniref:amidase n=1 Tax=Stenotrophomonas nitritireducens TaxID=83617 RepID=UPI001AD5B02E|nr:amidase [Stenotrophomonas nitritireducens]MBN8796056.1 amidase [Stenotrophomonas nitritireducens]